MATTSNAFWMNDLEIWQHNLWVAEMMMMMATTLLMIPAATEGSLCALAHSALAHTYYVK